MFDLQNLRHQVVLKQQAATNAATLTSDNIDTRPSGVGYDELLLTVHATTSDNATNNPSVLKLQESDDTADTNFADVTAFVGDGAGGFTIPNSPTATTDKPFVQMHVDLRKRKRYLRLKISPVTTQTFSAIAQLGRPRQAPDSDDERNVALQVRG